MFMCVRIRHLLHAPIHNFRLYLAALLAEG